MQRLLLLVVASFLSALGCASSQSEGDDGSLFYGKWRLAVSESMDLMIEEMEREIELNSQQRSAARQGMEERFSDTVFEFTFRSDGTVHLRPRQRRTMMVYEEVC